MPGETTPPTEAFVDGELIPVCREDEEVRTVVDIDQLLNMSVEERCVRALPVSLQRFMATCVLAGYKFRLGPDVDTKTNKPADYYWRAWDPQGNPVSGNTGDVFFTGLMFVLYHMGFNDWLRDAARRELQLRE